MKLRYTPQALLELDHVLASVAEQSPEGARRVRSRIHRALGLLIEHPLSGQLTNRPRLRRIVTTPYPYVIFYEARDGEVVIIGVRHASRSPSTMPGQT